MKQQRNENNDRNGNDNGDGRINGNSNEKRYDHFLTNCTSNHSYSAHVSYFLNPSFSIALQSAFISPNSYEWTVDTHANICLINRLDRLHNYTTFKESGEIRGLDDKLECVIGIDSILLSDPLGYKYTIKNTLYVPSSECQILSICQLIDAKINMEFISGIKNFTLQAINSPFKFHDFSRDNLLFVNEQSYGPQAFANISRSATK